MLTEVTTGLEKTAHVAVMNEGQKSMGNGLDAKGPVRLRWLNKLNSYVETLARFEARGITRVLPEERHPPSLSSDVQIALLWFTANISVNNLAVGLFGPMIFGLGFLDCAMCAVFGGLLGSMSTGYISIWGPRSGNRTMVGNPTCLSDQKFGSS
jgi:hypothetical protein